MLVGSTVWTYWPGILLGDTVWTTRTASVAHDDVEVDGGNEGHSTYLVCTRCLKILVVYTG